MAKQEVENPDHVVPEAYHGTELGTAQRLSKGEPFRWSTNEDRYLGDGAYFFEGCSELAVIWAKPKFPKYGVLCASIRLGRCLDLHSVKAIRIVRKVRDSLSKRRPEKEITLAAVINFYAEEINTRIETVRGTHLKCTRLDFI